MTDRKCETCRFFYDQPDEYDFHPYAEGECRIHAPTLVVRDPAARVESLWPETMRGDWCGDWVLLTAPTMPRSSAGRPRQ